VEGVIQELARATCQKELNVISPKKSRLLAVFVACALAALVAGCGSSGDAKGTGAAGATLREGAKAAIEANLAPYVGHPSAFPVDEPLTKKPSPNATIAYLQCAVPTCALLSQVLDGATKTLGVKLSVVKAGSSAAALQQAAETILAEKPAAVIIPAVDPSQYREQMGKFADAGIPVISLGVNDADKYPAIKASLVGVPTTTRGGTLLADRVLRDDGAGESVFYSVPELNFSPILKKAYIDEINKQCDGCKVREVDIPISQLGSTAPSTVVSDLQKNPKTKAAVFVAFDAAAGLPQALDVAGIKVDVVGFAPDPNALGYIKEGKVGAGLGTGLVVASWTAVDAAARLITGQPLAKGEAEDATVLQLLEKADITFDPQLGFAGYPDMAQRFAKLWGSAS